jgi:hypothetical protein
LHCVVQAKNNSLLFDMTSKPRIPEKGKGHEVHALQDPRNSIRSHYMLRGKAVPVRQRTAFQ